MTRLPDAAAGPADPDPGADPAAKGPGSAPPAPPAASTRAAVEPVSSLAGAPTPEVAPLPVVEAPRSPVAPARGPSEVALGAVLLVVLVGLAFVGQDHWRRGLLLAGLGLLGGAVARLVLPARIAGLLAVRGRVFDAIVLGGLGVAVIVLTTSVPVPSGG